MDKDYNIRCAKKEDCIQILSMIKEMAIYEKMGDQVNISLETLENDGFGKHPVYQALVVENSSNQIVGYSVFNYAYSAKTGRQLYIEDIFVQEPYRKKGIAIGFIKKCMEIALSLECTKCKLSCLKWNEPALNLYKKLGFKNITETENMNYLRFDLEEMEKMAQLSMLQNL